MPFSALLISSGVIEGLRFGGMRLNVIGSRTNGFSSKMNMVSAGYLLQEIPSGICSMYIFINSTIQSKKIFYVNIISKYARKDKSNKAECYKQRKDTNQQNIYKKLILYIVWRY